MRKIIKLFETGNTGNEMRRSPDTAVNEIAQQVAYGLYDKKASSIMILFPPLQIHPQRNLMLAVATRQEWLRRRRRKIHCPLACSF